MKKECWFATFVVMFTVGAASAQEISCEGDTFKGPEQIEGKTHTVFCQKWVETEKGLLTKPKKELVLHGPIKVYEKIDPVFGKFQLIRSGQMKDGVPAGSWSEYYPDGQIMATYDVDKDGKPHGQLKKFHPDGSARSTGQVEHGNPVGTAWKFFDPSGKTLAAGPYEEIKKAADKYDQEAKSRALAQQKENQAKQAAVTKKAVDDVKKNWVEKKSQGVATLFHKKTKVTWSEFMQSANWLHALTKCQKLGMNLPTAAQLQEAIENGLMMMVENPFGTFWSSDDKSSPALSQEMSLALNNLDAVVVSVDGQAFGLKKPEDAGIICVKK